MFKKILRKIYYKIFFSENIFFNFGKKNESNRIEWVCQKLKNLSPRLRILDAGAGEQIYKKYCNHLDYVSHDFAQYNGQGDGKGLQTGQWKYDHLNIISDITKIPQPDESFDVILCTEVFEHIPSPVKALNEFQRLLKSHGFLILTAPFCSITHFAPYHFYSGFNKYFYENQLNETGFTIKEISSNGNYYEYLAQELIRLESVADKYSKNKLSLKNKYDINKIIKLLQNLSFTDKNSKELLCFGWHVLAQKTK